MIVQLKYFTVFISMRYNKLNKYCFKKKLNATEIY